MMRGFFLLAGGIVAGVTLLYMFMGEIEQYIDDIRRETDDQ